MTSENRLSLDDALRHDRPTIDDESLAHLLESQMDSYAPDLPMSGLENESIVNQNATDGTDMTASDRIRGLLRDPSEHTDASGTQPEPTNAHVNPNQSDIDTDVHIKEESPGLEIISSKFIPGEIIDLSDTEDVAIKQEAESAPFNWTSMPAGSIMISDSDDEDEAVARANKLPSAEDPAKASPVRDLAVDIGRNMDELGENDIPRVTSAPHLGKFMLNKKLNSPAKPQPQDMADLRERQRASLEKALGNPIITGAGEIFKVPQPSISSASRMPDDDGFSWMTDTMVLDDEPAIDFQALKKSYKAKRKARANTLEDDIQFKKAHIEATNLLRKQALEMAEHDTSDEAEESEDGLFVREEPSLSTTKTPFSMSADSRADNDDVVFTGMLTGKRPSRQPNNKSSANEPEFSTKRSRANALKRELRSNMMAGIEAILLKDQRRLELQTAKAAEAEDKAQGKKTSHKRKTSTTLVGTSAKRTKTGRMSNVDSLMNSNIYEDSNANLDKPGLPQVTDKKKADFLTSLIANIPLEDWKQANDDRIDIVRASRILAKYKVVPDGKGDWAFKGMKSSLYHYQLQGAAYMKSREIGEQNPHGGILADEMGLGKTVQMIATMIANPQLDPSGPKCTLIVCSPALMGQWEKEIEFHAERSSFRRIVRHHGPTKYSGRGAEEEMERADIILTTYGEVLKSYPNCEVPEQFKTPKEKEGWWVKEWDEKRGLLHRALFYRVVLDGQLCVPNNAKGMLNTFAEAQAIKNHTSLTSIACRALMARLRWSCSGTPIQNRLEELFPYFKFLRVKHTGSISVFRHNFCVKDSDVCNKRLHSMLDGMMIRRTHQDRVLGAPLLKLPKNTQQTLELELNAVEKRVYDLIRMRCVKYINTVAKNGELEERFSALIIMFQRLRQMASHIFIVQEALEKELELPAVDYLWTCIITDNTEHSSNEMDMLVALRKMIAEKEEKPEEGQGTEISFTKPREKSDAPKPKKKKSDTLIVRFTKFLKELKKSSKTEELRGRTLCQRCLDSPEDPHVTSCLHLYCKECLNNMANDASDRDLDHTPCDKCGEVYTESVPCGGLKQLQIRDLSASVFQCDKDKASPKKPHKLTMKYVDLKPEPLLSTKTAAVKGQLEKWLKEDPQCKIIVFTEWQMIMHILGRVCQKEGWKCCHYNGKMSYKFRDESLSTFRDPDSGVKILIASLKCGGTGLNLTVASRVICVDLWYNKCVEQQAFARVFRVGQTQETYITRCVVKGTVDERLIAMQEEKTQIISGAMDDRSVMAQLTVTELMRLFGPVAYDENSKPFILVDDDVTIHGDAAQQPKISEDI